MQAKWGIAWLLTAFWLVMVLCAPTPGRAAADSGFRPLPVLPIAAQGSLETQMLGEAPLKPAAHALMREGASTLQLHPDGGDALLKLPRNLELNISIRYNRDPHAVEASRLADSPLYMKYSMDYRLLSNLKVGLNSYLYRPSEEGFPFQHSLGNQVMGIGPQLNYDLGRWSFLVKSQMEHGNLNRNEDLQNWFRVWYAF
jgi:hypothetical protein